MTPGSTISVPPLAHASSPGATICCWGRFWVPQPCGSAYPAPAPSPHFRWVLASPIHLKLAGSSLPQAPALGSCSALLRGGWVQAGSRGLPAPLRGSHGCPNAIPHTHAWVLLQPRPSLCLPGNGWGSELMGKREAPFLSGTNL